MAAGRAWYREAPTLVRRGPRETGPGTGTRPRSQGSHRVRHVRVPRPERDGYYEFAAIAEDAPGNVEPMRTAMEACVSVAAASDGDRTAVGPSGDRALPLGGGSLAGVLMGIRIGWSTRQRTRKRGPSG